MGIAAGNDGKNISEDGNDLIRSLFDTEDPETLSRLLIIGSTANRGSNFDFLDYPGNDRLAKHFLYTDAGNIPFLPSSYNGDKGEQLYGGTSTSTPQVSGAIACLWSIAPEMPGEIIVNVLKETTDKGEDYNPLIHGCGKINPLSALQKLRQLGSIVSVQ